MSRLPSHRRRGFAAILAITLILLVGATLAAVAAAFSADARRTRTLAADAQLRQLLTAGAIAAAEQLNSAAAADAPAGGKPIALPADLADRGAALTVTASREGDVVTVVVDAALATRHARQTVRFTQRDGRWAPTAAELN